MQQKKEEKNGEKNNKIKIAKKLIKEGTNIETVALIVELSKEAIEKNNRIIK